MISIVIPIMVSIMIPIMVSIVIFIYRFVWSYLFYMYEILWFLEMGNCWRRIHFALRG